MPGGESVRRSPLQPQHMRASHRAAAPPSGIITRYMARRRMLRNNELERLIPVLAIDFEVAVQCEDGALFLFSHTNQTGIGK